MSAKKPCKGVACAASSIVAQEPVRSGPDEMSRWDTAPLGAGMTRDRAAKVTASICSWYGGDELIVRARCRDSFANSFFAITK